jgi:hypothetical protein
MRIEDVRYNEDRHFYYEILSCGDRASFQSDIDKFLLHKDAGFIWVDLFNKLGQCPGLVNDALLRTKRQQLYQFLGHERMRRIVNKYAITEEDRESADKAMKTFQTEFNQLIKSDASFTVRCRYLLGY